jgi:hypothetical protein
LTLLEAQTSLILFPLFPFLLKAQSSLILFLLLGLELLGVGTLRKICEAALPLGLQFLPSRLCLVLISNVPDAEIDGETRSSGQQGH